MERRGENVMPKMKLRRMIIIFSAGFFILGAVIFCLLGVTNSKQHELYNKFNKIYIQVTGIFDETENQEKIMDKLNSEESIQKINQLKALQSNMNYLSRPLNQRKIVSAYFNQYFNLEILLSGKNWSFEVNPDEYNDILRRCKVFRASIKLNMDVELLLFI